MLDAIHFILDVGRVKVTDDVSIVYRTETNEINLSVSTTSLLQT